MSSVDVIVPCYRYGHFLKQCVQTVLAQTGPTVRVLIIDDASPDDTAAVAAELAREDARVTFLRHRVNAGHIATYNEGIAWVSAKYLLLLSADDYLLPGALSRASALMDAQPEVGFVFGNVVLLSDDGATTQQKVLLSVPDKAKWRILKGPEFIELSGANNIVKTPTAVVRTELQKRLGGYRPELPHSGDMEMWLRLAAHASAGFLDADQAVYRRHADCMTRVYSRKNFLPDLQQRKAAFDCFFQNSSLSLPNAQQLRRKLFRSLGCQALGFASTAFNEGELDVSEELSEFALGISPEVKRSWPRIKLACKRRIGRRAWRALQACAAICTNCHG
jgi:hypothetical protein